MTPKSNDPSTQRSLSAFFKRKSPPSIRTFLNPLNSNANGSRVEPVDLTSPPPEKRPKIVSTGGDDGAERKAALSQPASAYFGNPVDQNTHPTNGSHSSGTHPAATDNRPSSSRNKLASFALSRVKPPSKLDDAGPGSETHSTASQPRTAEQRKRHEEWQRRLEAPGGLIRRRRSLALDEAAAAEIRRASGLDVDTPDPAIDAETRTVETPIEVDSDSERHKKSNDLAAKFASQFAAAEPTKGGRKGKGKKKEEVGPSGQTYTPLEKQFLEIKGEHPDVLLLMEVGYKYKFHGDDAKIASKELGIAAFPSRNFYTASIPVYRLHIHVKKLISLGYKVGVISQTETAALKKISENRNAPFTRQLTHLFTAATYVDDPSLGSSSTASDEPILPGSAPPPTNALVALVETGMGGMAADDRVRIGLVSVIPGTGDVVWDEFDDSPVRSELETRLTHLSPAELLLPTKGLSKATEKVLAHFAGNMRTGTRGGVRVERVDNVTTYSAAFDYLTKFYSRKSARKDATRKDDDSDDIALTGESYDDQHDGLNDGQTKGHEDVEMDEVEAEPPASAADERVDPIGLAAGLPAEAVLALVDFPKQIVVALCIAVKYMKTFGLENAFRHRSSFTKFINRAHMLLSSNTLINLEIYRNQTDGGEFGSLVWLLDHTKTRMGRRLMREWIGRPLLDVGALQARVDAIDEIMENNIYHMEKLRSLLVNMPDLVRGLTRIQYGKATPTEIATILVGLNRIGSEFKPTSETVFASPLLNNILHILPTIRDAVQEFLGAIGLKQARENDEANLWSDPDKYPELQDAKDCISITESELDQHLRDVRKVLKRPTLTYVTVAGIEFLLEVPVRDAKSVPPKWVKVNGTKSVNRYHTPEILKITKEREQHKETLAGAARRALASFQSDISERHELVVVARQIAVIDCLMSLAQVAAGSGYCKPNFVAVPCLHVRGGRHSMVEMLRDEAYVPFDIDFSEEDGRAKVITGPNMAGKSSCVRATALIVCMAQIGSFVPASSVTLGIHDAVQTRMGASDEIARGKSTFMVELSETSDILRTITPRTLVILDELGRGTSTYDGVAIAYATLSHVAGTGCNTLFVTHYPMVAEELAKEYPKEISNWHMSFDEVKNPDGSAEITFLYKLTRGLTEASFGIWCGRLAGLPKVVLENAQLRSDHLRAETAQRQISSLSKRTQRLWSDLDPNNHKSAEEILHHAVMLHKVLRSVVK